MKILIDKNVNSKELKKLCEDHNFNCEILSIENLEQQNKKVHQTKGLLILGGPSKLNGRLGDKESEDKLEFLKQIIGKENMGDILHLEASLFEEVDYFITEDNDILSKRQEIQKKFPNLKILKLEEFKKITIEEN